MSTTKGWLFALSMAMTATASVLTHEAQPDRAAESGHHVTAVRSAAATDTGWG
jgi:hypothetical protein